MDTAVRMCMSSRFFEGLSVADIVTLGNAVLGFLAVIVAFNSPELAARLILIAAVADGVDGVLARAYGGSEIGPYLDSLADVSSFALAPAALVYVVLSDASIPLLDGAVQSVVVVAVTAGFVTLAILRLGVYTAHDTAATATIGAPTTLAATIIGAFLLTVHVTPTLLIAGTAVLAIGMVAPIEYPDLLARDAVIMGVIHLMAVFVPTFFGHIFPYALLTLALAYLVLGPIWYWGESERALRQPASPKGKRS